MYQKAVEKTCNEQANRMREHIGLRKKQYNYHITYKIRQEEGEESAYETVVMYTQRFLEGKCKKGLLLVGGVGSGKTFMVSHVANSIVNYITLRETGDWNFWLDIESEDWLYVREPVVFSAASNMLDDLRKNPYPMTYARYQECSLLILDDLGVERVTEWSLEILFKIVDYRYNEELPILITTNCTPEELKEHVGDRIFDRIRSMCALVPVTSPSRRKTVNLDELLVTERHCELKKSEETEIIEQAEESEC